MSACLSSPNFSKVITIEYGETEGGREKLVLILREEKTKMKSKESLKKWKEKKKPKVRSLFLKKGIKRS